MNFGVVVFPGSNCDHDCVHVLSNVLSQKVREVWHKETSLDGLDAVILPGGFSYGDYLRTGAIARFSPIMGAVKHFADHGGMVLGIGNGFQILLEAGLLPGAMLRNRSLAFICKDVHVRVRNAATPFTGRCESGQILRLPIHWLIPGHGYPVEASEIPPKARSVSAFLLRRGSVGPRSSGQFRFQQHGSGEVLALGDVAPAMPSLIAAMTERVTTKDLIAQHNLTDEEYKKIVEILGREPNLTELGMFSVMWSEHCSYKSSRVHLKRLPTTGERVVQGPGENAGAVDIGDGLVAVFKMESHNHPSFIEPYQGAATGVGGILRDIFTMGARPIALLDSLRFGLLDQPKNRHLFKGVVAGISWYGNCCGIPTVGGEAVFNEIYGLNPMVNVFCLGIAKKDRLFKGQALGVGNPVIYLGSKTGRDGIHGATMAADAFDEDSEAKRPTARVGDPFTEKLLLEACLELMDKDLLVGIQDMGAAGLTSSSCEMASRAGTGIELDLTQIPRREPGMTPYEVMLSESQERMLLIAKAGLEEEVLKVCRKWDLAGAVVGRVTGDGMLRVRDLGPGNKPVVVAEIPAKALADDAPRYERPDAPPAFQEHLQSLNIEVLSDVKIGRAHV